MDSCWLPSRPLRGFLFRAAVTFVGVPYFVRVCTLRSLWHCLFLARGVDFWSGLLSDLYGLQLSDEIYSPRKMFGNGLHARIGATFFCGVFIRVRVVLSDFGVPTPRRRAISRTASPTVNDWDGSRARDAAAFCAASSLGFNGTVCTRRSNSCMSTSWLVARVRYRMLAR